ncbi:MAG: helix-turn-helix domain-containing protein [Myxococcales bacterium]|nr:helix-turn-helix domain-containing protein [Myxococcales bacterium]
MSWWLSISDTAEYLGVSRQTIYREMARGRLVPEGRVGRSLRFSQSYLDIYLRESVKNPGDDSVDRWTGKWRNYALSENQSDQTCITRNNSRNPRSISGAGAVDERERSSKSKVRGSKDSRRSRVSKEQSPSNPKNAKRAGKSHQATVRGLLEAVAELSK